LAPLEESALAFRSALVERFTRFLAEPPLTYLTRWRLQVAARRVDLREDFCGFKALGLPSAGNTCLPFLWQNGAMTALPTLGGNNGAVNQINKNGEMAGLAESATPDPGCPAPQVLQFKPAMWAKWQDSRNHAAPEF
jgi:hypothetical protein